VLLSNIHISSTFCQFIKLQNYNFFFHFKMKYSNEEKVNMLACYNETGKNSRAAARFLYILFIYLQLIIQQLK